MTFKIDFNELIPKRSTWYEIQMIIAANELVKNEQFVSYFNEKYGKNLISDDYKDSRLDKQTPTELLFIKHVKDLMEYQEEMAL